MLPTAARLPLNLSKTAVKSDAEHFKRVGFWWYAFVVGALLAVARSRSIAWCRCTTPGSGRARLGAKKRREFANDFINLEAIDSGSNATKAAVSLLDPY